MVIRLDRETRSAYICTAWPDQSRDLARLFGEPRKATIRDGKVTSAFWTVRVEAVRFRAKKRTLTPARVEALRGALRKARTTREALTPVRG